MNNQNLSSSSYSTFWPQEVTLTEKLWGSKEDPLKTNNQVDQYPQAEEKSWDAEEKDVLVQPDLSSGSVRQHAILFIQYNKNQLCAEHQHTRELIST